MRQLITRFFSFALLAVTLTLAACGGGGGASAPTPRPTTTPSPTPSTTPSSQPTGSAADIDWPTFGFTSPHGGENTSETQLTTATVARLHLLWSHKIGDASTLYSDTEPIVAAGVSVSGSSIDVVYAGDERLANVDHGRPACRPEKP